MGESKLFVAILSAIIGFALSILKPTIDEYLSSRKLKKAVKCEIDWLLKCSENGIACLRENLAGGEQLVAHFPKPMKSYVISENMKDVTSLYLGENEKLGCIRNFFSNMEMFNNAASLYYSGNPTVRPESAFLAYQALIMMRNNLKKFKSPYFEPSNANVEKDAEVLSFFHKLSIAAARSRL